MEHKQKTLSQLMNEYARKNYKRYELRLRYDTHQHLIDYLTEKKSVNKYIISLLEEHYLKEE